jgi:hypothetical protein
MGSKWKRAAVLIVCLVMSAVTGAPAVAAGWTTAQLTGEAGTMFLLNVSCPDAGFCVATGTQNLIATSTDPTGGAAAWNVVYPGAGPFESGTPGPAGFGPQGPFPTPSHLQGISCPSSHLCVAVTNLGVIYSSTDPTGPASAWNVAELKPTGENIHLYGVSCPTESLCVAVSGRRVNTGKVFTSTDPTGGAGAWHEAELGEQYDLRAVSCSSATLCVAAGAGGELVASRNPAGGPGAWTEIGAPGGPGALQSIDCVTGICLTGNAGGNLLAAAEPTDVGSWREANGGGSVQITGTACASTTACLAVDSNGDVSVSTDPTGAHPAWVSTNLRPYSEGAERPGSPDGNALFGASCPSEELCVLVGARGAVLTSTEPFAIPAASKAGAARGGNATGKRRRRRGPKRPHARIVHLQFHTTVPGGLFAGPRQVKLLMRFHAKGPLRRFECQIDNRGFHPCRSPKRYAAIGRGVHSIGVRAVGVTGLRGPLARKRIYVGEICRPKECVGGAGEFPRGGGWKFQSRPTRPAG